MRKIQRIISFRHLIESPVLSIQEKQAGRKAHGGEIFFFPKMHGKIIPKEGVLVAAAGKQVQSFLRVGEIL